MTTPEEQAAEVLAAHGPSGLVNSREGWVECECGDRLHLPSGLDFDGYPAMWEEERKARDAHAAQHLAPLFAEERRKAWNECAHAAYDLGWVHDLGRDELLARNPYRERVDTHAEGGE